MFAPVLALLVAALPQDTVVDRPVYTDAAWRIALPRPADDWVFIPATQGGTTTVIFQPRDGALSDQLWGALAGTHWDGPVPLDEVADRRIAGTWRAAYGRSFTLLARDSLTLDGFPAIHLVMGGSITGAVVDVEEYLVARDSDLIVLQFRTPRGQPRDTVAEGYQRVIAGLDLNGAPSVPPPALASPVIVSQGGQVFVELPESLMAVAPGTLTSEVVSGGRRLVRWTHDAPGEVDSLVTVGRYAREDRRVGRITVVLWKRPEGDSGVTRATDDVVAAAEDGWERFWSAFGPVPRAQFTLVETGAPDTRGTTGYILLGNDLDRTVLLRELARTWWGGYVRADTNSTRFVTEWLPQWSAWLVAGVPAAASGPEREAFERLRSLLGAPHLREVLRTLAADRRYPISQDRFLSLLDEETASVMRPALP